jgi:hypothetical protein
MKWLALVLLIGAGFLELAMGEVASTPAASSPTGLTPADVAWIGKELETSFGVKVSGQWRSQAEDARRRHETGRKAVSDHVAGMALDFVGSPDALDRLAVHLRSRPEVAYVLWRVPNHHDHLHASFR